ncbi:MAG: CHAT domain-containing tetratricopeptide repeat protein [Candidatus Obscuribacterales bacterium]
MEKSDFANVRTLLNKFFACAISAALCTAQVPVSAEQAKWEKLYKEGSEGYIHGKYDQAELALRDALKECASRDKDYAKTEIMLADVLEAKRKYSEAKTLFMDALEISIKSTGEDSSDTASALWNLATFYSNRLHYAEAETLYEKIISLRKKNLGLNNAKTADAMADLSELYVTQRRFTEADTLNKQVLDIRTKLFGHESAAVAASLAQISNRLGQQHRYAEAEIPMKEALSIYQKLYGEDDSKTVDVLRGLADLYRVQGKSKEVQEYLDRIAASEKRKGKSAGHRDLYVKGKYLISKGRYAEAEPVFRDYQKLDDKPMPNTLVFKERAAQQAAMLVALCSDLHLDEFKPLEQKITGDADPKAPEYDQEAALSSADRFRLLLALYQFGVENPDKNTVRAMLKCIDMVDKNSFDSDSLVTSQAFLFTILRFASMNRRSFEMCKQCSRQYIEFVESIISKKNIDQKISLKNMVVKDAAGKAEEHHLSQQVWNSEPVAVEFLTRSILTMAYLSSDLEEAGDPDGRIKSRQLNALAVRVLERFSLQMDAQKCCDLLLEIAESCKMEGDYAQTKLVLSRLISLEQSHRSAATQRIRANALISLADVNLQECDYRSVIDTGQEAINLAIMKEPQMSVQRASVLEDMAQAAVMMQSEKAVDYAGEAIKVLKSTTLQGIEDLPAAASIDPNTFKARLIFAKSLIATGQPDAAITELQHIFPSGTETDDDRASMEKWLDVAEVCATLGDAQMTKRDFPTAKINYAKALDVHRQSRTKYSTMQQIDDMFNIAICNANLGDPISAASLCDMAAARLMTYSLEVFPDLSFAEQRNFVQQLSYYSSLLTSLRHSDSDIKSTFGYLLQWRGLLVSALRRQSVMADQSHDNQREPLVEKWRELKREISKLASSSGASDEALKSKIAEYSEQKEDLERQLLSGTAHSGTDDLKGMTADLFMQKLQANEAYIELSSYQPLNSNSAHYYAIVATPSTLRFIDIPDAESINNALRQWRQIGMYKQYGPGITLNTNTFRDLKFDAAQLSESSSDNSFSTLQTKLWKPIAKWLPGSVDRIILCDDGELSRLPWEMLVNEGSGRTFLTERVDSPRELLGLRSGSDIAKATSISAAQTQPHNRGQLQTKVTDPAQSSYLAQASAAAQQAPKREKVLLVGAINYKNQGLKLEGTDREISAISKLLSNPGTQAGGSASEREVVILTGNQPTPDKIKALLPEVSIAHLATHGFFAVTSKDSNTPGLHRAMRIASTAIGDAIAVRNPLVSSGILLAAEPTKDNATSDSSQANAATTGNATVDRAEEGELTAEELVELNLNKCKLIVLSACETGRGTEERGQGVLGLRSVLMAAGAKSLLLSLWSVDDEATSFLMTEFYKHLLEGKSEALSLQLAKTAVRTNPQHPNWKAPCYWAAWALVGKGW